jgi:hypothetical protein
MIIFNIIKIGHKFPVTRENDQPNAQDVLEPVRRDPLRAELYGPDCPII